MNRHDKLILSFDEITIDDAALVGSKNGSPGEMDLTNIKVMVPFRRTPEQGKQVIQAKRRDRKIGICRQAPGDFPEFAFFLVECGIDSISL